MGSTILFLKQTTAPLFCHSSLKKKMKVIAALIALFALTTFVAAIEDVETRSFGLGAPPIHHHCALGSAQHSGLQDTNYTLVLTYTLSFGVNVKTNEIVTPQITAGSTFLSGSRCLQNSTASGYYDPVALIVEFNDMAPTSSDVDGTADGTRIDEICCVCLVRPELVGNFVELLGFFTGETVVTEALLQQYVGSKYRL